LTPYVQESLVRLATWMSFGCAARELAHHARVQISATTARRLTEQTGAAYEAVQTAHVEQIEREVPLPPQGPAVQQLSVDGVLVPLVGGEWAEVKTVALGTIEQRPPRTRRDREREVHTVALSYFARLADHQTFTRLATVETQRRGTETAGQVCAVVDGAAWIQGFIDTHRPDAVRILDWPHALGYVAAVATAVYGAETPAAQAWFAQQRRTLREAEPETLLQTLQALQTDLEAVARGARAPLAWTVVAETTGEALRGVLGPEGARAALAVVQDSLTYLEPRRDQLRYATFLEAGYPIGSGSVESANKLLVEARLKGAGMHWARHHVNPMVALRTVAYGERWAEAWPQIVAQQRQQARASVACRRAARAQAVAPTVAPTSDVDALVAPTAETSAVSTSARVTAPPPVPAAPHRRRPHKPAADHPWRRLPIGRAHCA
jgi:hypothetical protein